jgi:cysteinyl-tRNA synthetase
VLGLGTVTVRKDGRSTVFPAGSELSIADLVAAAQGGEAPATQESASSDRSGSGVPVLGEAPVSAPLREEVARLESVFNASLEECDAPAAVRAVLALEETIQGWSHDTDQSDALANARSALRSAIVCLGEMAVRGTGDPADLVRPFVDALLAERVRAREARDWAAADTIRDRLLAAGIELHDAPDGTTWELRVGTAVG